MKGRIKMAEVERYVSKTDLSSVVTKINTKLSNRYTKAEVDSAITTAISGVTQFNYQLVDENHPLPAEGTKGVIYLVPNTGSGTNTYDEKIWIVVDNVGRYETLGQQNIDLSNYLQTTDVKVDGTTIIKTPDQSGNGFTLSAAIGSATTVSEGTGIAVTHTGNDYAVALSSTSQTSLGKADTAVQKADIKGTTDKITVTEDASGNGVTISLSSAISTGAAAGSTALQPGDVSPLTEEDVDDLLDLITDDE